MSKYLILKRLCSPEILVVFLLFCSTVLISSEDLSSTNLFPIFPLYRYIFTKYYELVSLSSCFNTVLLQRTFCDKVILNWFDQNSSTHSIEYVLLFSQSNTISYLINEFFEGSIFASRSFHLQVTPLFAFGWFWCRNRDENFDYQFMIQYFKLLKQVVK